MWLFSFNYLQFHFLHFTLRIEVIPLQFAKYILCGTIGAIPYFNPTCNVETYYAIIFAYMYKFTLLGQKGGMLYAIPIFWRTAEAYPPLCFYGREVKYGNCCSLYTDSSSCFSRTNNCGCAHSSM